jgi:hypothetical protein
MRFFRKGFHWPTETPYEQAITILFATIVLTLKTIIITTRSLESLTPEGRSVRQLLLLEWQVVAITTVGLNSTDPENPYLRKMLKLSFVTKMDRRLLFDSAIVELQVKYRYFNRNVCYTYELSYIFLISELVTFFCTMVYSCTALIK